MVSNKSTQRAGRGGGKEGDDVVGCGHLAPLESGVWKLAPAEAAATIADLRRGRRGGERRCSRGAKHGVRNRAAEAKGRNSADGCGASGTRGERRDAERQHARGAGEVCVDVRIEHAQLRVGCGRLAREAFGESEEPREACCRFGVPNVCFDAGH